MGKAHRMETLENPWMGEMGAGGLVRRWADLLAGSVTGLEVT